MSKKYTMTEVKDDSRTFVHSLDRSPLGRYAVDTKLLVIADTIQRLDMLHEVVGGKDVGAKLSKLNWKLSSKAVDSTGFTDFGFAPEVFYWWLHYGDAAMCNHANTILNRSTVTMEGYVDRLRLIAANRSLHPYFHVGIWDVSLINKFIADGVDPALAIELNAGR